MFFSHLLACLFPSYWTQKQHTIEVEVACPMSMELQKSMEREVDYQKHKFLVGVVYSYVLDKVESRLLH